MPGGDINVNPSSTPAAAAAAAIATSSGGTTAATMTTTGSSSPSGGGPLSPSPSSADGAVSPQKDGGGGGGTNDGTGSASGGDDSDDSGATSVRVAVRVRPFLPSETGSERCIDVMPNNSAETAATSSTGQQGRLRGPLHPTSLQIGPPAGPTFTYDTVHPPTTTQNQLYATSVRPLVHSCLKGYNATVLAYGQTGSGKTFTILGPGVHVGGGGGGGGGRGKDGDDGDGDGDGDRDDNSGAIPRALRELFDRLDERGGTATAADTGEGGKRGGAAADDNDSPNSPNSSSSPPNAGSGTVNSSQFTYEVRIQFLELYGEQINDLLTNVPPSTPLKIRDNGTTVGPDGNTEPEVVGASEVTVKSAEEALLHLARGMLRRVTGATAMNAESSRSHAIMTVVVEQTTRTTSTRSSSTAHRSRQPDDPAGGGGAGGGRQSGATDDAAADDDADDGDDEDETEEEEEVEYTRSKFHFVDLAGSERAKRSLATGTRLKEGIDINKGLLVLGNVISALGDPKKAGRHHVPYRDSKLTRLLRGSLGGNHRTLMVACVSPSSANMEESLNCLRYANRARNIQNRAVVNLDANSRLVKEVKELRATVEGMRVRVGGLGGTVRGLAGECLRVRELLLTATTGDGEEEGDEKEKLQKKLKMDEGKFTEEVLKALAEGSGDAATAATDCFAAAASSVSNAATPASPPFAAAAPLSPSSGVLLAPPVTTTTATSTTATTTALIDRLSESEAELSRVTASLKRSRQEAYQFEEGLFAAKAEGEYWRCRAEDAAKSTAADTSPAAASHASIVAPSTPTTTTSGSAEKRSILARVRGKIASPKGSATKTIAGGDDLLAAATPEAATAVAGSGRDEEERSAIMARMASYEKEIAGLKAELRDGQAVRSAEAANAAVDATADAAAAAAAATFPAAAANTAATAAFGDGTIPVATDAASTTPVVQPDPQHDPLARRSAELDEEDRAEREAFCRIARRYLANEDGDEDVQAGGDPTDGEGKIKESKALQVGAHGGGTEQKTNFEEGDGDGGSESSDEPTSASVQSYLRRRSHLDAHLLDLTKSIAAKEDLIEQLHASQRRYESMRQFYESKLGEMETQVHERERERETLASQLNELKKHEDEESAKFVELRKELEEREAHIAKLRKKQRELAGLTQVPTRNEAVLTRLKTDIVGMKRQKVDLQKKMSTERKAHLLEVAKLRKDATQRGREAAKWKVSSQRKQDEADRAKRAARSHLEEVGRLRSRYREAEKKLRMQTLKRGVMERVGLDPVLVGRRGGTAASAAAGGPSASRRRPRSAPASAPSGRQKRPTKKDAATNATGATVDDVDIDVDKVRSYLDSRVADVGRTEAVADKLAKEWEDHLELTERREGLVAEADGAADNGVQEELEALSVQIRYREGRIRQLTRRLGERPGVARRGPKPSTPVTMSVMDDQDLRNLCPAVAPLPAARLTSRVLFGMVVRERRRVASLARTASALDVRAAEAERIASEREEALLSNVEEGRHERAEMVREQQERIVALMSMVRDEEETKAETSAGTEGESPNGLALGAAAANGALNPTRKSCSTDSMVMILSDERISVLTGELAELQGEREAKEVHRRKEAEARDALEEKELECTRLQGELQHLKSSLRQIRETLSNEQKSAGDARLVAKENKSNNGENSSVVPTERDETDEGGGTTTDGDDASSHRIVDDIIRDALHPSLASPRKGASDRSRLSTGRRIKVASCSSPRIVPSPNIGTHVALMHSSDSEEEEDMPEWANDIMADLALIAQGEMPPSLKKRKDKKLGKRKPPGGSDQSGASVFDRLTDPGNFTGVQKARTSSPTHAEDFKVGKAITSESKGSNGKSTQQTTSHATDEKKVPLQQASSDVKSEEKPTKPVFDRLTDPEHFTGIQKQSFMSSERQARHSDASHANETKGGKSSSSETMKGNKPTQLTSSKPEEDKKQHAAARAKNEEKLAKPVFDRLTDPDLFTGIQKQSFMSSAPRKSSRTGEQSPANETSVDDIAQQAISDILDDCDPDVHGDRQDGAYFSPTVTVSESQGDVYSIPTTGGEEGGGELHHLLSPRQPVESNSSGWDASQSAPLPSAKKSNDRSVFDRLVSPSNYTGTQKTAHKSTQNQHGDESSDEIDEALSSPYDPPDNIVETSAVAGSPRRSFAPGKTDRSVGSASQKDGPDEGLDAHNREWVAEYTQQDVFERLQKTVTHSYAVKHQPESED